MLESSFKVLVYTSFQLKKFQVNDTLFDLLSAQSSKYHFEYPAKINLRYVSGS